MECMAIDPEDHEGAWKKRVGQLEVPDICELASGHSGLGGKFDVDEKAVAHG